MPLFEMCGYCNRPLVCRANLVILRRILLGASIPTAILGGLALPLFGFGLAGVAAGSAAAAWQSSIGLVAAGSLFAGLQSLGATGLGILLFGSIGLALPWLGRLAPHIHWCSGDCGNNKL